MDYYFNKAAFDKALEQFNKMNLRITGYDKEVNRSDPEGLHITYDMDSDRPIVSMTFWMNDGATPLEVKYPVKQGTDGRYFRGINVKPTISGDYYFYLLITDDQGNSAEAVSETPVKVTSNEVDTGDTTFPFPELLRRFEARYPVPHGSPGDEHEENCRQWSIQFAEQVAFENGQDYGVKRAGNGRPISKDSLAQQVSHDVIWSWDLLIGTGTGSPVLAENPEWHDISDQIFESVNPVNHLK